MQQSFRLCLRLMSNRRKAERADNPIVKRVPAVIHWDQIENSPRTDDEIVGQALIFEDGTQDLELTPDISEDAQRILYGFSHHLTIGKED